MRRTLRTNPHSFPNIPRHGRKLGPSSLGAGLGHGDAVQATLRRPTAGDSGSSAFVETANLLSTITAQSLYPEPHLPSITVGGRPGDLMKTTSSHANEQMTIHMSIWKTTRSDRHAAGASCSAVE